MAALPAGIKPVVENYSMDDPGGTIRTEVAGGAARYSLDWDRGAQRFQVTLNPLDALKFSIWSAFYFHTIHQGADPFDLPMDSGAGVALHSVHIVPGSYAAQRVGGVLWSVSFVAETDPEAYGLTDGEAIDIAGLFNTYGIKPVVAGYGMDDAGGVARDDVPGGRAGYARDCAGGMQRFSVTLILPAAAFRCWSIYYHRIIKKGTIAFPMPLDSGFGVSPHQVNIMPGSYSAARTSGTLWAVTFVAEAESQAYSMSEADAAALVDIYNGVGAGTNELLARIAKFVLVDTLVLVGQ
jgi:hypothetical protein